MPLRIGDTFKQEHLWVVLNDPSAHDGAVVCVNLTSSPWEDDSCILNPSDFNTHPDFYKVSRIRYDMAKCGLCINLEKAIQAGRLRPRPRLDLRAVRRIQSGGIVSDYLKNQRVIRPILRTALLPEDVSSS